MDRGKALSVDQLRQLIASLEILSGSRAEISELLTSHPEVLRSVLTPPFYWATFYELPFREHVVFMAHVGGILPLLLDRLHSDDPLQATLDLAHEENVPDWDGGPDGQFELKYLFGVIYSLNYSIESMVTWGRWLNELVADVRDGNDAALFKAVQIDRTIMSCPSIADRITLADYEQDDAFFKKLRNALRGKPKKPKEEYAELRYLLYTLETTGELDELTVESAYHLFCEELRVYPIDTDDPARSLWQFIRRWKKARHPT